MQADPHDIKVELARRGVRLIEAVRAVSDSGITYDRAVKILGGYRLPRSGELEALRSGIEKAAGRRRRIATDRAAGRKGNDDFATCCTSLWKPPRRFEQGNT